MKRHIRPQPSRLRILYRGEHPGTTVPPWAFAAKTGRATFATMVPGIAGEFDSRIERLELSGDAKVMFEGSREFPRISTSMRTPVAWVMDVLSHAAREGYDAVWFRDQNVGVAILNKRKIVTRTFIRV